MAKRNKYTAEQIIIKLREAEVLLGQGRTSKKPVVHLRSVSRHTIAGAKSMGD